MILPVKVKKEWGYYNVQTKKMSISPQFDFALPFINGTGLVFKDTLWNFIDDEAKFKINKGFAQYFTSDSINYTLFLDGKYALYNCYQNTIVINYGKFDKLGIYSDGLISFCKDGKWGYSDALGNIVISPIYNEAYEFAHNLACVSKDKKYGLINKSNKLVYNYSSYFPIVFDKHSNIAKICFSSRDENGNPMLKYGLINTKLSLVIDTNYTNIGDYNINFIVVKKNKSYEEQLYGIINKKNKQILPYEFKNIYLLEKKNLVAVNKFNSWGLLDLKRSTAEIKYNYESIFQIWENGNGIVVKDNKLVFLLKNQINYNFQFDDYRYLKVNGKRIVQCIQGGHHSELFKKNNTLIVSYFDLDGNKIW